MRFIFAAAFCLLSLLATAKAAVGVPTYANQFYIKATMSLPYAEIAEPIESWYDGSVAGKEKLRTEFYGGLDKYVFRNDLDFTWQVNPQPSGTPACFATQGQPDIRSYLPDLTGFILQPNNVVVNGVTCKNWQLSNSAPGSGKTSVYNFYSNYADDTPVQYVMMGYDSLIGSHFDLYRLDYSAFKQGADSVNPNLFNEPSPSCGPFPGPGFFVNPMADLSQFLSPAAGMDLINNDLHPAYRAYLIAYGKQIDGKNLLELRQREKIFLNNQRWINHHNRKANSLISTYRVAINHLADHTPEEMRARKGIPKRVNYQNNAQFVHERVTAVGDLPAEVDWTSAGAVTPPQDQGICGSCWSFGSTGAIEGAYFLKYGSLHVFAQQELMDCSWDRGNNACDGGEDYRAYDWVIENGGISFKSNYGPYLMADGQCKAKQLTPDVVLTGYVNVTSANDDTVLQDALYNYGPQSVSIDASHPGLSFYVSGVYNDPACKRDVNDLDHSVLAAGYGTDPDSGLKYWLIKNSWSTYWGDQGYIKIARGSADCGVATQPTYVLLK